MTILSPADAIRRREALGMSRPELARIGFLSKSSIKNFEAGHFDFSEAWRETLVAALEKAEALKAAGKLP